MKDMLREVLKELVYIPDNLLGIICDFLKKLNADKTGEFLKQFKLFLRGEMTELAEQVIGYLKLISGSEIITIGETDGKSTIAHAEDTFRGYIDSDFVNYGTDVQGQSTKETKVQVFEMIKNGTFAQVFGGFGENIDRLCLSQSQIICFVKDHSRWLRTDGYATFFLFKENGEYFVAGVHWDEGRLRVGAGRLSDDAVWSAEGRRRIVVPQL
jgi:hypothetical protein